MQTIENFFDGNYLFNLISFLIGFIGILLAIIFYYKALKDKKPIFDILTFRLIDETLSKISKLDIKYNNSKVNNLSVSKIAIWNSGKEPIKQSDFASNDHLRVVSKSEIIIYDFEIIRKNDVNKINVERVNEKTLNISFEFLNYNDGLTLNIYHNGCKSSDLEIIGTFIGSQPLRKPAEKEFLNEIIYALTDKIGNSFLKLFIPLRIILFPLLFLIMIPFMFIQIAAIIFDIVRYQILNKTPAYFDLHKE